MSNRLANENSPYLLQHAENPVDWYPWGEEAFHRAREDDKPIFLSVGYAACHWCHVMAHESFEDETTAEIMNENFINIKVDREERPDIDQIYMQAVVAMTRQGGWPMSVFITPQGQPFYGGTYFPPKRRYQMPSFPEILTTIARLWREDRGSILQSAGQITDYLKTAKQTPEHKQPLDQAILGQAVMKLAQSYDWNHGGWGSAPKFPQAMVIEFLLRQATREDKHSLQMAEHALIAMAKGGMYDVVGGGFARYSVDDRWLVPHFEKMLYDNALLSRAYLHAYTLTKDESYRRTCQDTLSFICREMTHPLGGFYSSLDADSEGEEGKYYVWTLDEIGAALSEGESYRLAVVAYGIMSEGNFEGANVLQRALDDQELAKRFSIPPDLIPQKLAAIHQQLLRFREKRVRPETDDKVLVSWNALMSIAFAEAGRYLDKFEYTKVAQDNLRFLLEYLYKDDRLHRSWRNGEASHNAFLEDYAALILALLALYQSDHDPAWFNQAERLTEEMVENFSHPKIGFYDTRHDHEDLLFRPKDTQDNATPSGNALAAMALLQVSAYTGRTRYNRIAVEMLESMIETALTYPTSFGQWLSAADFALGPVQEAAVLGGTDTEEFKSLQEVLWQSFRPRLVAALSAFPIPDGSPPLLADRSPLNDQPTAYVCRNFTCQLPVNTAQELKAQLGS